MRLRLTAILALLTLAGCQTCGEAALSNDEIIRQTKICADAGLRVRHEVLPLCGDAISRVQCDFPDRR